MAKIYERLLSTNILREKRRHSFDPQRVTLLGEDSICTVNLLVTPRVIVFFFFLLHFKVDRPQTTVVAKNLSVLQLFISRMPKMCAILQLVSAPLNPIPIAEHFKRSHPQCEHSCEQHIYMSKENNAKQNEDVI